MLHTRTTQSTEGTWLCAYTQKRLSTRFTHLFAPSSYLPKRNWKRERKYSISYKLGTHNAQQSIVQHHVEVAKIICFLPVSEAVVAFLKFSSFTLRLNSPNPEKSLRFTALYPSFISLNGEKQQLPGTVARKNWIQGLVLHPYMSQ